MQGFQQYMKYTATAATPSPVFNLSENCPCIQKQVGDTGQMMKTGVLENLKST